MLKAIEIKPDVFWVGGIDWNERNFHGYTTERGSTYNAYLILDEKITLIDTCKKPFTLALLVIVVVSKLTPEPSKEVTDDFDTYMELDV